MRILNGRGAPLRIIFLCLLSLPGVSAAQAQWTGDERATNMQHCISSCQNGATARTQAKCPAYCDCAIPQTEAAFPDYKSLERDLETANVKKRLNDIAAACVQRIGR